MSASPRTARSRPGSVPAHARDRRRSLGRTVACERLEDLTLLSAYLFIDYGDNFAGGTLKGTGVTTGALFSHTATGGVNINGPSLDDGSGKAYGDATSLILNSFSTFYGASAATMRTTVDAMVQREYAALDVTIVDLTATATTINGHSVAAAANFDDVSRTLAASGDGHDSYVMVGQAIINGTASNTTTDPTLFPKFGYGGIASDLDFNKNLAGNNTHEGTALALLQRIVRADGTVASQYGVDKVAQTIAHEAGHLFGLTHTWRTDPPAAGGADGRTPGSGYGVQLDRYSSSDTMSYDAFSGLALFSRVPEIANSQADGSDNTHTTLLTATPTPYDHMKADPGVGARDIEYVTGTGANDIITIARATATTATVTVQPFDNTDHDAASAIRVPGQTKASYSYTIDLTRPLLIDGGNGVDQFVIDGDLGTTITLHGDSYSNDPSGNDKADTLIIRGKGAAIGTYMPGTNNANSPASGADFRGSIVVGAGATATTINFDEFNTTGNVSVTDITNFSFVAPAGPPTNIGDNNLSIRAAGDNRNEISGSVSGVDIVPLIWSNVQDFTLDLATNVASTLGDIVRLVPSGATGTPVLVATGLRNFTINAGAGNDRFESLGNFALPVAGGTFRCNAGGGTDLLRVVATGTSAGGFAPSGTVADAGTYSEDATQLLSTGLERSEVSSFTNFALATPNDATVLTIAPDTADTNAPDEDRVTGSSGGVAITSLAFFDTANVVINAIPLDPTAFRGNQFTINSPGGPALRAAGLRNFSINSGAGNDTLTVFADDFRLPVAGGQFTFNAGTGAYADGTAASNLRGLLSLDQIVVTANLDYDLADGGTTLVDGTTVPDLTAASSDLRIASAGSGTANAATLGSIHLIGVEWATLTGGSGVNLMDASRFSGSVELDGLAGNDVLVGGSGANVLNGGDGDDLLFAGDDRFAAPGLGSAAPDLLGGGGTNVLHGGPGNDSLHADLAGTASLFGDDGSDTFVITNRVDLVNDPRGGIRVDGGGQAGDTLDLVGGGNASYNQTFLVDLAEGQGEVVTTNNHNPTGPTITQHVQITGLAAINDSIAANRLLIIGAPGSALAGATPSDLATGRADLLVNGVPFATFAFTNKAERAVVLADGSTVMPARTLAIARLGTVASPAQEGLTTASLSVVPVTSATSSPSVRIVAPAPVQVVASTPPLVASTDIAPHSSPTRAARHPIKPSPALHPSVVQSVRHPAIAHPKGPAVHPRTGLKHAARGKAISNHR